MDLRGPAALLKSMVNMGKKPGSAPNDGLNMPSSGQSGHIYEEIQKSTPFCPPGFSSQTSRQPGTGQSHPLRPIPRADMRLGRLLVLPSHVDLLWQAVVQSTLPRFSPTEPRTPVPPTLPERPPNTTYA